MTGFVKLVVAVGASAMLVPAPALAQQPGSNDPQAGTPAGTVYEIPLDTARRDAAPRTPGGGSSSASSPSGSPLRSENNLGSSAQVPGVATTSATGTGSGSGSAPAPSPSQSQSGAAGSSRAAGGSRHSAKGGGNAATRGATEALIRPQHVAGPSSTRVYLLLVVGAAVALALGAAGRAAWRRH